MDFGADQDSGTTESLVNEILKLDGDPVLPWKEDFIHRWGLGTAVGSLSLNTGWIIGFVVFFGIIIAPINLFFFAPLRFRHRLFWTVPLISVAASVLLAAVIVFQDGFGGTGARFAAVLLLPEEHKMAVIQEQRVRTALLLSQKFPLPEKFLFAGVPVHAEVAPQGTVSREGDLAGKDWFSSRTVRGYQLKAILPTRARIEIVSRNETGAPVVLSSLPVNLKDFSLVETDGTLWTLPELKTGERCELQPSGKETGGIANLLKEKASANLQQTVFSVMNRRGYFYARAGTGNGLPVDTLGSIRWVENYVIYLGAWTEGTP
jgi:hypothetical protein